MENPATWSEAQKVIGAAMVTPDDLASVYEALKSSNLLADDNRDGVIEALTEVQTAYQNQGRVVGQSLTSRMYYKLVELGHVAAKE